MNRQVEQKKARRRFESADVFRFRYVQDADLSCDGKLVVYTMFRTEGENDLTSLWLLSVDTGELRQLTFERAMDAQPKFAPNGREIAFLSNRSGMLQIHVMPIDGGEARQITSLARGVRGSVSWSPDGRHIAFCAGPQEPPPPPGNPYRITRSIYWVESIGRADNLQDIYLIGADGKDLVRLTAEPWMSVSPVWLPDGSGLLYKVMLEPDSFDSLGRFRVVTVSGEQRDLLIERDGAHGVATAAALPDGRVVCLVKVARGQPFGAPGAVWVVSRDGREAVQRTTTLAGHVTGDLQPDTPAQGWAANGPVVISPDGGHAFVPVQQGGEIHIYRVALDGDEQWTALTQGERACVPLAMRAGRLLYFSGDMQRPGELFILDESGERQLTELNRDLSHEIEWPRVRHLKYPSADGVEIEGWLLEPPGGKAPFPTILYVHGGPNTAWGHSLVLDAQLLAGAGYAVLLVNYRGSTGYGREFVTGPQGRIAFGTLDYQDLMAAVDHCVDLGLTDADRLGVCGLSNGGRLSCWIVGQTPRFKAAVAENPVTNHISLYGVGDMAVLFCQEIMGGHLHEMPDMYWKSSPLAYAHRCTTPTLLVQGENDVRCPAEQSEQFYTSLKVAGCTVEMLRFPNMGHWGSIAGPVPIRRAQNSALLEWMDRYVKGTDSR